MQVRKPGVSSVAASLRFFPNMSLQDYREGLNQAGGKGTHPSQSCGDGIGSFLACYLKAHIIDKALDAEAGVMDRLATDAPVIDALLSEKKCEIIFHPVQLNAVFEVLIKNQALYRDFLKKNYLNPKLKCENGDTFLSYFFNQLDLNKAEDLDSACALIDQDASALDIRGKKGHPITILIKRIMKRVLRNESIKGEKIANLLELCRLPQVANLLTPEENKKCLEVCFALLESTENTQIVLLGFQAAVSLATFGLVLHEPMKGVLDSQTSLFERILELDASYQWGVASLRELMRVAGPETVKLKVAANRMAVEFVRCSVSEPDNVNSYVYIESDYTARYSSDPDSQLKSDRIVSFQDNHTYSLGRTLSLEVASVFYKPSAIISAWKREPGSILPLLMEIDPHFSVSLASLSHRYLPRDSQYREMQNGVGVYSLLDRRLGLPHYEYPQNDGYYHEEISLRRRKPSPTEKPSSTYGYNGPVEEYLHLPVPSLIRNLYAKDDGFFAQLVTMHKQEWKKNNKDVNCYYYRFKLRPAQALIKGNALLVYLQKGGALASMKGLSPAEYYIMKCDFRLVTAKDPRLMVFSPGQIKLSVLYRCDEINQSFLRPFTGNNPKEETQFRVYDFELLKQFKKIGFDFSAPEITSWIVNLLLTQKKLTLSLFELLSCLRECGAVFPEKIGNQPYDAFIIDKLAKCRDEDYQEWLSQLAKAEKSVVDGHLLRLGLAQNHEAVLAPGDYKKCFEPAFASLNKPVMDYPKLLEQWFSSFREEKLNMGQGHIYNQLSADYAGAMVCLNAYLASGEYANPLLMKGESYFEFFFIIIKDQLQQFKDGIEEAMSYKSENKNGFFKAAQSFKRKMTVGTEVATLQAQIDEILWASPGSHELRVRVMEAYQSVNQVVRTALSKKGAIGSKRVRACYEQYDNGSLFANKSLNLASLVGRDCLVDIIPENMHELLPLLNTDAAKVIQGTKNPSAPLAEEGDLTYVAPKQSHSSVKNNPAPAPQPPVAAEPLYPKVHDDSPKQPLSMDSFEALCAAYKKDVDQVYEFYRINMPELLGALSLHMEAVNDQDKRAQMPSLRFLPMLICQNTKAFAQYPCFIDANRGVYYDLDAVLDALRKGLVAFDGVQGDLTPARISLKPVSEIALMAAALERAKMDLELLSEPAPMAYFQPNRP